ncbi:MAG: cytochrome c [Deltaproteobacteria bacterium]|nr:cytochrome c [Deltaproteobacteria bacterium]
MRHAGSVVWLLFFLLLASGLGWVYFANADDPKKAAEVSVSNKDHLSPIAWTASQWGSACSGVRTSYNPNAELSDEELSIVPGDQRWLDFVFWTLNNKIAEHQVEQYGGTGWDGPAGGVIFYWAPGSHWERNTLASFGFTIGHVIGEHRWTDTMFPDFFERFGGVYGINVKDRLVEIDPSSPVPWVEFLEHIGGATSPYYRYLFHQEAVVDPTDRVIHLLGGQGVSFTYSFERYFHELREVLTDCRAVDFFKMYDLLGHGFASEGNWARQNPPKTSLEAISYLAPGTAPAATERYDPNPPAVEVPTDLTEAPSMRRGQEIYLAQCGVCHGIQGDGDGFLAAGFDVKPRDFTGAVYKFRSTENGDFPLLEDIERIVREGVPGTTMPAWGQFLTAQQISDVSKYLIAFSTDFVEEMRAGSTPKRVPIPEPPANFMGLADHGKRVYEELQCSRCHGDTGEGDGPAAGTLEDSWGEFIRSTDLTNKWVFRNGHDPEDIYRTFVTGLNGTPMPSFDSALPNEDDRWGLVAYILSLSPQPRPAIRLEDFAKERRTRIGTGGRVLPKEAKR